jgi:outer membrane protein OmpA-like peptidoglycan-associated protein
MMAQEYYQTVWFEYDKSDIPDSAMLKLVKFIHSKDIDRVLIEAHCDSIGSRDYNKALSMRRANEVKRLLTDNGVSETHIKTCLGYGKDRPITNNETPSQRQQNRRALITFYVNETKPKQKEVSETLSSMTMQSSSELSKEIKQEATSNLDINELKVGQTVALENVYFWGGRHVLKEESFPTLQELVYLLRQNPTLEIEIEGHVCCTIDQPDGYDWDTDRNDLSVARARAIYEYLVSRGISKRRLNYKGYGGSRKINLDESTEELRSVNRRVEFKVIKL